jgi:hypothetical protein
MDTFTYCPLKIRLEDCFIEEIQREIDSVPSSFWYQDDFRGSMMLALYTSGSEYEKGRVAGRELKYGWTPPSFYLNKLRTYIDEELLKLANSDVRVFLLKTPPQSSIKTHIDCKASETAKMQMKFRYVLSGRPDSLYFVGEDGESRIFMSPAHGCYIIDGGHPHGVVNNHDSAKITLCLGSPWDCISIPVELFDFENKVVIPKPRIKQSWCDQVRLETST